MQAVEVINDDCLIDVPEDMDNIELIEKMAIDKGIRLYGAVEVIKRS